MIELRPITNHSFRIQHEQSFATPVLQQTYIENPFYNALGTELVLNKPQIKRFSVILVSKTAT